MDDLGQAPRPWGGDGKQGRFEITGCGSAFGDRAEILAQFEQWRLGG
jgi:hypothetical protein